MKTLAKPRKIIARSRRRRLSPTPVPSAPLSNVEFRRQLHRELADEIAAARQAARARFADLLRPPSAAEAKARSARVRAMFAKWEEESRRHPPTKEECESYDRMLARMQAERAG